MELQVDRYPTLLEVKGLKLEVILLEIELVQIQAVLEEVQGIIAQEAITTGILQREVIIAEELVDHTLQVLDQEKDHLREVTDQVALPDHQE